MMKILKRNDDRAPHSSRRRNLRLESLEDRNLLSTSALAYMAPAEVQSATRSVPMTGTIEGVATLINKHVDRTTGDVIVHVMSEGSGRLSPLGEVTLTETHTTVILASSGYTRSKVEDGQATITAANGDQLSCSFTGSGYSTANGFNDTFSYAITGGTGQFTGVNGSGHIHSTDIPPTGPTQVPFIADFVQ
jgi:hypothetical protein